MLTNSTELNALGAGLGTGQPIVAPTFVNTPPVSSPYVAPAVAAAVPALGNTGWGNGGFLESLVLLSLLGNRNGLGLGTAGDVAGIAGTTVLEQNVSELRKDVQGVNTTVHELGNEIQGALAIQSSTQAAEFRNLDNQICDVEKEAIKAQYESKIATLQATNEITNKIDTSTVDIKNQLFGISTAMASEFCDTKHLIERGNAALSLQMERGFCQLTENSLRDQIAALRDERDCFRRERASINDNILMSQQTNSILNAIDSQLQKQTSQIVQLGGANVATPTNSNTQTTVS